MDISKFHSYLLAVKVAQGNPLKWIVSIRVFIFSIPILFDAMTSLPAPNLSQEFGVSWIETYFVWEMQVPPFQIAYICLSRVKSELNRFCHVVVTFTNQCRADSNRFLILPKNQMEPVQPSFLRSTG